ncbi:hypothetical protein IRZ71_07435 [Flavobacterium sp. ANB]|uniref:hypothetical protein n=1 Tax=unclassified Flavobacterium TaxID=196869 RepID=UPI0012B9FDAA|nr:MULTISPECIES: hypothetical protein [unclassified Flavobacterium]MBF4516167.1 hypothetical protein [Flavobacterium sp. ANB]MTD69936.1 hypothetical protein [Flavobacterium sp. LC2016-13]
MKYIRHENIFVLIGGILLFALLIWWIRSGDIRESKKLEEQNLEMDSITKMRSWRVYIIAGFGIIAFVLKL